MIQKHFTCVLALALTVVVSATVSAQDPNHSLSVSGGSAASGASIDLTVNYDNISPDNIAGWSFGCGHDSTALTLDGVVDGSTTATVNGGTPPQFNQVNQFVDGFTVGVVISFIGQNPLPPGTGYEFNVASYTNNQAPLESTDVCFTDLLGAPPVTTVVVVAGQSVVPVQACGTVSTPDVPVDPAFVFTANDTTTGLSGSFTATCAIQDTLGGLDDTQGFSMGLSNDAAVITPIDLVPAGPVAAIGGGAGPGFFGDAQFADGWTVGVVYSFIGGVFIQFPASTDVVEASYDIVGTRADGETTDLVWTNGLGMPMVANVVVVAGGSVQVAFDDGVVTFLGGPAALTFLRGDCNNDSIVNIADGIWLLNELFLGGPASACVAACDANGDTMVDSSDATYIFMYRFMGGATPVAPFPACGDSILDADLALGCAGSSCP